MTSISHPLALLLLSISEPVFIHSQIGEDASVFYCLGMLRLFEVSCYANGGADMCLIDYM